MFGRYLSIKYVVQLNTYAVLSKYITTLLINVRLISRCSDKLKLSFPTCCRLQKRNSEIESEAERIRKERRAKIRHIIRGRSMQQSLLMF